MNEFASKKILVVDDTTFLRASMIKTLVGLGFSKNKIVECENGQAALGILTNDQTFDLVLSDWNMPEMNGLELLKTIRSKEGPLKDIPVVFVTTVSEKNKIVEAIKYRLSGYIIKPVQEEKLSEVLNDIFIDEVA